MGQPLVFAHNTGRSDRSYAVGDTRRDRPPTPGRLPAQGSSMGMGRGLVERIAEHVVKEAQQAIQRI